MIDQETKNLIDNLERRTQGLERLLKSHTHSGIETSGRLDPKNLKSLLIDSLKYTIGGTSPETDGTYNFSTASGKVASITIKSGIITDITLTP